MKQNQDKTRVIAIIVMIFLFGMIALVTNLAAPIGVIWKNQPALQGSTVFGMMGNMMNFLAYFFMGIPSGMLLTRIGYKKTALVAVAVGFLGVFIQFLAGFVLTESTVGGVPANYFVYLFGAFVAGISVCLLNTVVNPMLNILGGGGNKGNQLILIGGTVNSSMATLTPMLIGALIGQITKDTAMADVNLVLYLAMAIFVFTFLVLLFVQIQDPQKSAAGETFEYKHSPWAFRHFVLGTVAIFLYVGVEVGIPGTLIYFLSDTTPNGGGLSPESATRIAGFAAGTYWFLMLVGRFIGGFIADKVSSKQMMVVANALGLVFLAIAIFSSVTSTINIPVFTGQTVEMVTVPKSTLFIILCGLCTSVMWSSIFNLATEGLGKYTAAASGIFMMMVVGGGIMPLLQSFLADHIGYLMSYIVPILSMAYMLIYALFCSKNVNTDIPVE